MTICEYNVLYKKLNNFLYTKIIIKRLYKQLTVSNKTNKMKITFSRDIYNKYNNKKEPILYIPPRYENHIIGNSINGIPYNVVIGNLINENKHDKQHTHCYVPPNRSSISSCYTPPTNNIGPTNNANIANPDILHNRPTK